jgi:hypothetical protein
MTQGVMAAYHELDALIDAIEALKARNFAKVVVYTPTPRHEIDHVLRSPVSPVRRFTLIGALLGASFGWWIAIWTSDYWPMVVGGKPVAAWLPYTIIAFEVMVLVGALSTVAGMFVYSRVPKITATVGFDPRFTGTHYGIYVETAPERLREAESVLRDAGAAEVTQER